MPLSALTLSLQFARFDGVAEHRAALARHKVSRWIRHALALDAEITVRIVDAEEGQALHIANDLSWAQFLERSLARTGAV